MEEVNMLRRSLRKSVKWGVVLAVFPAIVFFRLSVAELCVVSSTSMTPTLSPGDCVLYEKVSYGTLMPRRWADVPVLNAFTWISGWRMRDGLRQWSYRRLGGLRTPWQGDVVVFRSVTDTNEDVLLVKRVSHVLMRGSVISIDDNNRGQVALMAEREGNTLLSGATSYVLKQNFYFMEGDNAAVSSDSRMWGYVPDSHVLGRMVLVLWSWDSGAPWFGKIRWSRFLKCVR